MFHPLYVEATQVYLCDPWALGDGWTDPTNRTADFRRHLGKNPSEIVADCRTCSKYDDPVAAISYHLSICSDSVPFHAAFPPLKVPNAGRSSDLLNDFYQRALNEKKQGRAYIDRAFVVAAEKARKDVSVVNSDKIVKVKRLSEIQKMLCNCKYPEDEEDEDRKFLLPMLLLKRAKLLVTKPPVDVDYASVLADLDMVEKKWSAHLPSSNRHNLFYLQTLCQMRLELFADAKVSMEKAREALSLCTELDDATTAKITGKLDAGAASIEQNKATNRGQPKVHLEQPVLSDGANARFPALSSKVDVELIPNPVMTDPNDADLPVLLLRFMAYRGRGVVAKSEIRAGEILAVEAPSVSVLRNDLFNVVPTHCHHCLLATRHLIPCSHCCLAMFCSLVCRDAAMFIYHKFECKLGFSLLCAALGSSFQNQVGLALRLLFSHKPNFWVEKAHEYNYLEGPEYDMTKHLCNGIYSSYKLKHLFNLEHKEGGFMLDELTRHKQFVKDAMKLVRDSGYLSGQEEADVLVTKVVSHVIAVARLNSLVMTEEHVKAIAKPEDAYNMLQVVYGQGIYNTISMFNHSCVNNAVRFDIGKGKTVVVSRTLIEPGQEIHLSYVSRLLAMDWESRFNILTTDYNLVCNCMACYYKWSALTPAALADPRWPHPEYGTTHFLYDLKTKNLEVLAKKEESMLMYAEDLLWAEKIYCEMMKRPFDQNAKRFALWGDIGASYILRPLRLKHCVHLKW